ncbi:hypothetical protein Pcinc_042722 [Petrolisthes cinctipes]|uniref:Uncharacterized protein n=1 Tax=Petrolisthes cinctipes TaxID=88211 RepID=A0AAE1BGX9_PETCI|nr:hypothetical protein Pcinc_042722 [Petrolisthes cinctipes]
MHSVFPVIRDTNGNISRVTQGSDYTQDGVSVSVVGQHLSRVPIAQVVITNPGERGLIPAQPFWPPTFSITSTPAIHRRATTQPPNLPPQQGAHAQTHTDAHLNEVESGVVVLDHGYREAEANADQQLPPVVLNALKKIRTRTDPPNVVIFVDELRSQAAGDGGQKEGQLPPSPPQLPFPQLPPPPPPPRLITSTTRGSRGKKSDFRDEPSTLAIQGQTLLLENNNQRRRPQLPPPPPRTPRPQSSIYPTRVSLTKRPGVKEVGLSTLAIQGQTQTLQNPWSSSLGSISLPRPKEPNVSSDPVVPNTRVPLKNLGGINTRGEGVPGQVRDEEIQVKDIQDKDEGVISPRPSITGPVVRSKGTVVSQVTEEAPLRNPNVNSQPSQNVPRDPTRPIQNQHFENNPFTSSQDQTDPNLSVQQTSEFLQQSSSGINTPQDIYTSTVAPPSRRITTPIPPPHFSVFPQHNIRTGSDARSGGSPEPSYSSTVEGEEERPDQSIPQQRIPQRYLTPTHTPQTSNNGYLPSTPGNQPSSTGYLPSSPPQQQPPPTSGYLPTNPAKQPPNSGYLPSTPINQTPPSGYLPSTPNQQPSTSGYLPSTPINHTPPSGYLPSTPNPQPSPSGYLPSTPNQQPSTSGYLPSIQSRPPSQEARPVGPSPGGQVRAPQQQPVPLYIQRLVPPYPSSPPATVLPERTRGGQAKYRLQSHDIRFSTPSRQQPPKSVSQSGNDEEYYYDDYYYYYYDYDDDAGGENVASRPPVTTPTSAVPSLSTTPSGNRKIITPPPAYFRRRPTTPPPGYSQRRITRPSSQSSNTEEGTESGYLPLPPSSSPQSLLLNTLPASTEVPLTSNLHTGSPHLVTLYSTPTQVPLTPSPTDQLFKKPPQHSINTEEGIDGYIPPPKDIVYHIDTQITPPNKEYSYIPVAPEPTHTTTTTTTTTMVKGRFQTLPPGKIDDSEEVDGIIVSNREPPPSISPGSGYGSGRVNVPPSVNIHTPPREGNNGQELGGGVSDGPTPPINTSPGSGYGSGRTTRPSTSGSGYGSGGRTRPGVSGSGYGSGGRTQPSTSPGGLGYTGGSRFIPSLQVELGTIVGNGQQLTVRVPLEDLARYQLSQRGKSRVTKPKQPVYFPPTLPREQTTSEPQVDLPLDKPLPRKDNVGIVLDTEFQTDNNTSDTATQRDNEEGTISEILPPRREGNRVPNIKDIPQTATQQTPPHNVNPSLNHEYSEIQGDGRRLSDSSIAEDVINQDGPRSVFHNPSDNPSDDNVNISNTEGNNKGLANIEKTSSGTIDELTTRENETQFSDSLVPEFKPSLPDQVLNTGREISPTQQTSLAKEVSQAPPGRKPQETRGTDTRVPPERSPHTSQFKREARYPSGGKNFARLPLVGFTGHQVYNVRNTNTDSLSTQEKSPEANEGTSHTRDDDIPHSRDDVPGTREGILWTPYTRDRTLTNFHTREQTSHTTERTPHNRERTQHLSSRERTTYSREKPPPWAPYTRARSLQNPGRGGRTSYPSYTTTRRLDQDVEDLVIVKEEDLLYPRVSIPPSSPALWGRPFYVQGREQLGPFVMSSF